MKTTTNTLAHRTIATAFIVLTAAASFAFGTHPQLQTSSGATIANANLQLRQFDVQVDSGFFPNSNWGGATLRCPHNPQPLYFNLTVNGRWVVRNMLVVGSTDSQRQTVVNFGFDLQNPLGVDVPFVNAGFDVTPLPVSGPPPMTGPATVFNDRFAQSGGLAFAGPMNFSGPGDQEGKAPAGDAKKNDFPNQEQGTNECTNTAVSNSLKYLKAKHGLTIPDEALSPAAVGGAIGTGPMGSPLDWPDRKIDYCNQLAKTYGAQNTVHTAVVAGNLLDAVAGFCDSGADVEADMIFPSGGGHTVVVTSCRKNADGTFTLEIQHDLKQGEPGGTEGTHPITVDATGKVIVGTTGIPVGTQILRFVREVVVSTKAKDNVVKD